MTKENKEDKLYKIYYDAMEDLSDGNIASAENLLQKILKNDVDFVEAYNGLMLVYMDKGDKAKAYEYADLAYAKTKKIFPKWPKEMEWAELDNRKYLRAVCNRAIVYHENEDKKNAEKLYRLLLKLNPGDNQGVRYLLSALYAGLLPEVVDERTEEGNRLQDHSSLEELLEEQNAKHGFWKFPEEESIQSEESFDDSEHFFDDCPICQAMKEGKTSASELKEAFKEAEKKGAVVGGSLVKENKEQDLEEEIDGLTCMGGADDFKMPKWMDCAWRRVSCNKDDCPICSRIKSDKQKHIEWGEDPDSCGSVFEDVSNNFREVREMIKKDTNRMGIDITNLDNIQEPPKAEEFPLYQKVTSWRNSVFGITEKAETLGEVWTRTELFADLMWYANLLPTKTYRQLCNKWHIEQGDAYGEVDFEYTGYVLKECIKILGDTFTQLQSFSSEYMPNLIRAYAQLNNLEKEIASIKIKSRPD